MWSSSEIVSFARSQWLQLGGTVEQRNGRFGSSYLKHMHPAASSTRACLAVDLDPKGHFTEIANLRITSVEEWDATFREVAHGFDRYLPAERGVTETGRQNRVECIPRRVPDWRANVSSYLELCRDHWSSVSS